MAGHYCSSLHTTTNSMHTCKPAHRLQNNIQPAKQHGLAPRTAKQKELSTVSCTVQYIIKLCRTAQHNTVQRKYLYPS